WTLPKPQGAPSLFAACLKSLLTLSVNVAEAVAPEDAPTAYAAKPSPKKLCWITNSLLEKLPSASAVAETLPSKKKGSTLVSKTTMLTVSFDCQPVPVKVTCSPRV